MFRRRWALVLFGIVLSVGVASAENAHQVTFPPAGYSDAWGVYSPRGDKLAFGRVQHSVGMLPSVFVVDLETGIEDTLVSGLPPAWNPNGGLQWSPDGRQIAFMGDSPGVGSSVWVTDVPLPPLPQVLASTETNQQGESDALTSDGTIYRFDLNGSGQISSQVLGNLFGGPPPSPILSAARGDAGGLMATLQNGDVWQWIGNASQGVMVGNIFLAAGVTAVETSPRRTNNFAGPRPNPFNPTTTLPYTLASPGSVSVRVYDVAGRLVRTLEDGARPAGSYAARWDGTDAVSRPVASGTYIARITFPDGTTSEQKMTVLK